MNAATVAITVLYGQPRHSYSARAHSQPNGHAMVCFFLGQRFDHPGSLLRVGWRSPADLFAGVRFGDRLTKLVPERFSSEGQALAEMHSRRAHRLSKRAVDLPPILGFCKLREVSGVAPGPIEIRGSQPPGAGARDALASER